MTEPTKPHRITGGRVSRVAPLVGLAGRTAGEAVVASLRTRRRDGDSEEFHRRNAQRYVERLGRSKGVLMKAGQILSYVGAGIVAGGEYPGAQPARPATPMGELEAEFDSTASAGAFGGQGLRKT
ncbi:MAG TPA: hypothetical protein VGH89_00870, partial [Pseudonocardia sp.]